MKEHWVTATEFKAKCLALLDEVEERGERLTITKRGRPVATVQPAKRKRWRSPEGILAGKVELPEDIDKLDFTDLWDALRPGVTPAEPSEERPASRRRSKRKAS